MKNITLTILILSILFVSCKKDKIDIYEEVYEVEIIGLWNVNSHPTDFRSNAHFSPMIGVSHLEALDVIGAGLTATEGIQEMAETGATDKLEKEFDIFRNLSYGLDKMIGKSFDSPGSNTAQIGVERGRHHVTLFSMIAPSPDWFIAATTNLIDPTDGLWYDEVIVYTSAYDAGTDSGTSFTSPDMITDPKEAIQIIEMGPLTEGTDSVVNMAKIIFRRVK